jgi:hypothetical protein
MSVPQIFSWHDYQIGKNGEMGHPEYLHTQSWALLRNANIGR